MTADQAVDALTAGGVFQEHAVEMVNIVEEYGNLSIIAIWPGPDSWGSEIDLDVSYRADSGTNQAYNGYSVKFTERKLW